jgi:glycine/D-amino acid oxidase-like deaminating enzyme
VNEFVETLLELTWHEPKSSYDVVIVGGGGHGLATAYYLATRHGITNVAVIEADYIGSGNSGRNTTIIRANYGIPESIRFYQHSLDLYSSLEQETGCWIMHAQKGLLWLAHTESAMRTERARALLNSACGAETVMVTPTEIKQICPQIDLSGGGRYPVLGASYHIPASTARHDRVVWAYAQGAMQRGVHVLQQTRVTGLLRDGDRVVGVRTDRGDIVAGTVMSAVGGNVSQRLRAGLRADHLRHRTALLHQPDGPRPDAHRARVRPRDELLAAVVVPVPAGQRGEDELPAPLRARPQDPAAVDRPVRRVGRLLADHGLHRRRGLRDHHRLGHLGLQGDPGRRRVDGRSDRHRAHP